MKQIYLLLTLTLIAIATSCTKLNVDEAINMGYDASLGVPVCKFHSSIFEILAKVDTTGYVYTNPEDMSLHVYWEEKQQEIKFDFVRFNVGDTVTQTIDFSKMDTLKGILAPVPEGTTVTLPRGTYTFRDTMNYSFSFDKYEPGVKEVKIDSIVIDKANINMLFNMNGFTFGNDSRIELSIYLPTIKECTKNRFNAIITSNPMYVKRVIPRFTADFSDQHDGTNHIDMVYEYKIVSDGTATITKGGGIEYTTNFNLINFNRAHGRYWDTKPAYDTIVGVRLPEAIRSLAKDKNNKLLFHNPELSLYLKHNVGVDVRYVIDYVRTLDKDGNILKYADFGGSKTLTNYLHRPSEPYDIALDTVFLNRENGKTNELFAILPDSIELGCHVYVGKPDGGYHDFVVEPMRLLADLDIHLEMMLDAGSCYSTSDTVKADLASVNTKFTDYVNIDEFHICLVVKNSLPVGAHADLVMLDENNEELYKMPEGITLECPEVDEKGVAMAPTGQELDLVFVGEDVKKILKTKKICFKVSVSGKDAESMVTIHADNAVDAEVSAYAKFKANFDNILK